MKLKHTPGPWKYALAVVNNAPNVFVVTNGKWGSPNIIVTENEANARLIASAPTMLEALIEAREYIEGQIDIASEPNFDGSPRPNKAMQLSTILDAAIRKTGII